MGKIKRWIKILGPGQSGSAPLLTALLFSVGGVIAVASIVRRSADDNKAAKMSERREQAQQTPLNAAVIAKELVNPGVPEDSISWSTEAIPSLYLDPYVPSQDVIDGKADINGSWRIMNPPGTSSMGEASWVASNFPTTRSVTIFTTDTNQILPSQMDEFFRKAASHSGQPLNAISTLPRASANVVYNAINCKQYGTPSPNWTGFYCIKAEISSENSAALDLTAKQDSGPFDYFKKAGINKNKINLGLLPPPPLPTCETDGPNIWTRNTPIPITIKTQGVVTGYKISIVKPDDTEFIVTNQPKIYTAGNGLNAAAEIGPFNIDTSDPTIIPRYSSVNIDVEIYGPRGSVSCPGVKVDSSEPPPVTQTCRVSNHVGVWGHKSGGHWLNRTETYKYPNMIQLPTDATNIQLRARTGDVDDSYPYIAINGTELYRKDGGGAFAIAKQIPNLKAGSNSVTLIAWNKHTYFSVWFIIAGTYEATSCDHKILWCQWQKNPNDTCRWQINR